MTSAKELPYFEGDFWPNVLEESIKELEQEEEERKREENSTSNESIDVRLNPTLWPSTIHTYCFSRKGIKKGYQNNELAVFIHVTFSFLHRIQKVTVKMQRKRTTRRQVRTRAA